jgi:hypothetical protein
MFKAVEVLMRCMSPEVYARCTAGDNPRETMERLKVLFGYRGECETEEGREMVRDLLRGKMGVVPLC